MNFNHFLYAIFACLMIGCGRDNRIAIDAPEDNQSLPPPSPTAEPKSNSQDDDADKAPSSNPNPQPADAPTPKPTPPPIVPEPSQFKVLYDKVEFKVFLPQGFTKEKSRRLAVFLHGDTANGYFENYFTSLKDFALKNGFIFVAALSPNRNSWWHENVFADDLHKALTTLQKRLNFSSHDILWSGVSGGSTFLTMQFIPKVGKHYSGVVAATCGGARSSLFNTADLPLLKSSYQVNFVYGDQDFLVEQGIIPAAIAQYTDKGFPVTKKVLPNTAHCAFDVNKEIIRIWAADVVAALQ